MTERRQAPEAVDVRAVVRLGIVALLIGAAATGLAAILTPAGLRRPSEPHESLAPIAGIERDLLERTPGRGIAQRRDARRALDRYGWHDREHGVAEIPIERAMELVVDGVRPSGAGRDAREPRARQVGEAAP
ncbi:MAG: hypothetical protein AB7S26_27385 [Sandaracinaceae bacterium]